MRYASPAVIGVLVCLFLLAAGAALLLQRRLARRTRHLKASEARLNTILDGVDSSIYIKDLSLKYVYGNGKVCGIFKKTPDELVGCGDDDFFCDEDLAVMRHNDLRVLREGVRVTAEEEIHSPGAPTLSFLSVKIPLRGADGRIEALCGISTEITEHRAAQQKVQRIAFYDPLTNLPNRRLLIERIDQARAAIRNGAGLGALVFIDLDHFKRINDARGHDVGDAVLCGVAQRLKDVVGHEDTVARMGGDEFVILLVSAGTGPDDAMHGAMAIAEQLRASLARPLTIAGHAYIVGGSVGVTLLHKDDKTTADVLHEADTAMYRSKELGRNRVAFFNPEMHAQINARLALERDLVDAIGTPQLQMALQTQYDRNNEIVGAELLMRWTHPVHGSIPPSTFIPIAEETGAINALGAWALQQACRTLLQLQSAQQHYPVSVNVSPREFKDANFVANVRKALADSGAPGDRLIIELTEGLLVDDMPGIVEKMSELAILGVRFALDDFGTGYSSLTHLRRMPLYQLKIDDSFVREIPRCEDTCAIVRLILAMAAQLQLHVVAEGIENQEQADFLLANGCDAMQGFLCARPVPVQQWLAPLPA
ncbi:MAG TPA: EAL domain-containing protein [Candidimonas sp.]|nr:EAL domain-containing protein [Candidimonas sp.]